MQVLRAKLFCSRTSHGAAAVSTGHSHRPAHVVEAAEADSIIQ
jgi:hypothetical protein